MRSAWLLNVLLLAACGGTPSGRHEQIALTEGSDPRVGTFVSSPHEFSTSSYWIEGPEGLILIDTQFTPTTAEKFLEAAERETGKKAVLAVVLHANPDKFNGTATLQARGIRVVTSEQVKALIPHVHEIRHRAFYDRYKPDYPNTAPNPDSFGSETTTLQAAGTEITLHVVGPGCSEAHVVAEWHGHVFVGDLIANGVHSWLEIGKVPEWLERLHEIEALHPRWVHPGRGASGGPGLIAMELGYLQRVLEIVAASHPTLPVNQAALDDVRSQIEAGFPGYGFAVFLRGGLPAVYTRMAERSQ